VGGYGSGRRGGTVTAEGTASYVIDIKSLVPAFRKAPSLTGTIPFNEGKFPVVITVDTTSTWTAFVELTHFTRDDRKSDRFVTDRVRLVCTTPTYGGRRWWFICPRTARRTTKLFLPNGGWHFWSRQAYRLGYACQREGRFNRLQRRAAMLNRQLGGDGWGSWDMPPPKPKWMRWRTYEQKYEVWRRVVEEADGEFTLRAARLLKWL
jgi:hypothetical protein